jgi:hypothetical protein
MALITLNNYDFFHEWRTKLNSLSSNVGDIENLSTFNTTDIISAINESILNHINNIEFTISSEVDDVITVTGQLKKNNNDNYEIASVIDCYLTSSPTGFPLIATLYSGGWNFTTGSLLFEYVTGKYNKIVTDTNGTFTSTLTETGDKTSYMVAILPDGRQIISPEITHVL